MRYFLLNILEWNRFLLSNKKMYFTIKNDRAAVSSSKNISIDWY